MRPSVSEETIEELTIRANEVTGIEAETLDFEQRLELVLDAIDRVDGGDSIGAPRWHGRR